MEQDYQGRGMKGMQAPSYRDDYADTPKIPDQQLAAGTVPYKPPKAKIRDIHIQQLDHGYIVGVGCQSFAISGDVNQLLGYLSQYLHNPHQIEEKYLSGKLF